jgi:CarD family transcriptional regulator, regulator of rRNA transcription
VVGGYAERVRLAVGDLVAYPAHGAGRIVARERRMGHGASQEVVVLEFADALSVTLPVELARTLLRPLLNQAELRRIDQTLREQPALRNIVWLQRRKETEQKIAAGDPLLLAEVVRDSAYRRRRLIAKGSSRRLSPTENDLYEKARRLLSGEISLARGLELNEADAWIDQRLATDA